MSSIAAFRGSPVVSDSRTLDERERAFVETSAQSCRFNRYRNFSLIGNTEAARVLAESAAESGSDVTRLWQREGATPVGLLRIVDLPWDTDIYKRKMGRVTHLFGDLNGGEIRSLVERTTFDHLAVRVDASDLNTQEALTEAGFFPVDSILTYLFHATRVEPPKPPRSRSMRRYTFRPYETADRDSVLRITAKCYARYQSRYHADPWLREHSAARYLRWAEEYVDGEADQICVAESKGRVVGYIAFRYDRQLYRVLGMGCYGAGLGASTGGDYLSLLRYTLLCTKAIPWQWAECETQVDNQFVRRIYQDLKLEHVRSEHTYHLHLS